MIKALLQLSLIYFILVLLPVTSSSSFIGAKPNCQDKCGNLWIPFPFGIGRGCYLERSFEIICDNSANPPKAVVPFISGYLVNNTEVIEISQSEIRVKYLYLLARACNTPNSTTTNDYEKYAFYVFETQYSLSEQNWITALGCDDLVLGIGEGNQIFSGGCVSYCAPGNDSSHFGSCPNNGNGYSAGNGCCRTPIPDGTTVLRAQLTDLSENWNRRKLFPCSYAFIEERQTSNSSGFEYPLSYLNDSTEFATDRIMRKPPVVRLDWRIGNENCSQARLNLTTYACKDNSVCDDRFAAKISGYLCYCQEGYEGNPYLPGGCQDIDECLDHPCDSSSDCVNTPGSFECLCRKGYGGDGKLNGTGCYRLPLSKMINVSIGLGSGLGFLLLLLVCFWSHKALQKRKNKMRKERFFKRNGGLLLQQQTTEGTLEKTKLFSAKELEKATDNFNKSRILGQGGQGTVYKGMLADGKIVAVKKSKLVDEDQVEQFINEVVILSHINHRNVVQILGCCLETEVPLLVYEFVPNGTLFDLIHDPRSEFQVSWNMRLKIAADIAGAIAYLHSASSIPIYHRDIKSTNILLDEKFAVKVSDFGTSRSVAVDQTHLTTLVKGTFGYFDPEYFQSSQFTEKSDVYSFGVVLVELLTGEKPISMERTEEERSLAARFLASMEANSPDQILDSRISEQGRKEDVVAVARLAQRCLNLTGKMRPTMKEVATELESLRISQMNPIVQDEYGEARFYEAKPMMISDNDYTWTTSGRSVTSPSSDSHPFMFETM